MARITSAGDIGLVAKLEECEFLADGRVMMQARLVERVKVAKGWCEDGTQNLWYAQVDKHPEIPAAAAPAAGGGGGAAAGLAAADDAGPGAAGAADLEAALEVEPSARLPFDRHLPFAFSSRRFIRDGEGTSATFCCTPLYL